MQIKCKYGLTLVSCFCSKKNSQYKCRKCRDFGEYWVTSAGGIVEMGMLLKRANRARQAVDTQRDRDVLLTS